MTLRVIASGGTFDKHYDEIAGKLQFGPGHLAEVIRRSRMTVPVAFPLIVLTASILPAP